MIYLNLFAAKLVDGTIEMFILHILACKNIGTLL